MHQHTLKSYKPGEFIAMQGDIYRSLYILCNGTVRTQMVSAEGKQLTIETLRAPKLLAPAFIFASENRFPVNIETLETSEVLVLNKDAFLEFMHQYPVIMQNFLKLISDRSLFLSKKLNEGAEKIYAELSKKYNCEFDDRGNIGKRYRRQDEIGTPFCVTYDFESENDGAVTVRDRDTMEQERIKIEDLDAYFAEKFNW